MFNVTINKIFHIILQKTLFLQSKKVRPINLTFFLPNHTIFKNRTSNHRKFESMQCPFLYHTAGSIVNTVLNDERFRIDLFYFHA